MAQVATRGEVETEHAVAGPDQREEHGKIGLTAGVRLYVGIRALEQFTCTVHGGLLGYVGTSSAAVIASTGVSFKRLVRHFMTECVEHGSADDILGSDELDLVLLPPALAGQRFGDQRIPLRDTGRKDPFNGRGRPTTPESD